MALNWNWDDKLGVVKVKRSLPDETQEFTLNIYKGNAFAIFVYETTDDSGAEVYTLHNFFSDKTHAKRLLGLDRQYKDTYGKNTMTDRIDWYYEYRLDTTRKDAKELAELLVKAKWDKPLTIVMCKPEELNA